MIASWMVVATTDMAAGTEAGNMAEPVKAGSGYLVGGMDSFTLSTALTDREYVAGMNVCCRGGIVQTRPGTKSLVQVMRDAVRIQGFAAFTPTGGIPHLVAAVDGMIFVSALPFTSVRQLTALQFNPTSRFVAFETCLKSTEFDESGELYFLDRPYNVLMIQDGATRAAYWDGATSRHLNPTPSGRFDSSGDILTIPGFDETFIGLFMKWSGNRLWVSRDGQVFASDFGNPLKFTEAQYINEGRSFYLTGECSGMIETPDQSGLIVFTADNGTLFKTSIQDRTLWLSTVDFNKVIFPDIGCVAPFSPIRQYGLIWWFSAQGLINSDQAMATYRTSRIDYKDSEMMCSKGNLGPDLGGICTAAFENYLLVSVPSGDTRNRHTWCLDQAVLEDGANAWDSYWTGWHPVQWATARMNGHERVFFISKDNAGCVKIWEANQPDRTDNGAPITCFLQTKSHVFDNLDVQKRFVYAEVLAQEILGDVSMMIGVGGVKGAFYRATTKEIVATKGAVFASSIYDLNTCMYGNKPQTRTIRTNEDASPGFCNTCGVESDQPNNIDREFSLLIVWSGRMGVTGYGMTAVPYEIPNSGTCEANEEGFRSLSEQGCSAMQQYITGCAFEEYNGAAVVSVYCPRTKQNITASALATSIISEADAIRKATASAQIEADRICNCETFVYVNVLQRFTAFCEGVAGTSKTVIIPAGRYSSTISQADADAQAYNAARAQAEAELVCPPPGCGGAPDDLYVATEPEDYEITSLTGLIIRQTPFSDWRHVISESGRAVSVGGSAPEFSGNSRRYLLEKNGGGFDVTSVSPTEYQSMGGTSRNYEVVGVNGFDNEGTPIATGGMLWPAGAFSTEPAEDTVTCLYRDISPDGQWILGEPGAFSSQDAVVVKTEDLTVQALLDDDELPVSINREGGRRFTACSDRLICTRSRFDLNEAGVWENTTGGVVDGSIAYQGISGDGETIWIQGAGGDFGYLPDGNTQLGAAVMIGLPPGCTSASRFYNAPDNSRIFVQGFDGVWPAAWTWTLSGGWQLMTDYLTSVGITHPGWVDTISSCSWDGKAIVALTSPGSGINADAVHVYYIP